MKLALFLIVLLATASATDWIKCTKTAIQMGADVYQLVKDAKSGDVQKIVADLQTILADVQNLMKDCGIKEFTPEAFEEVLIELSNQEQTDWLKCAKAALSLGRDVSQLVKDAKTKDIQKIVKDLQQILADIQEIKASCGIKLEMEEDDNTDWLKCAQSAIKLGSSVAQLVKDAKTKDIQKIVKDLQQILADIQDIKTNCGIKSNTDWLKCAQSAIKLGSSVAQLVKDAKTKDIQKIVKDLQQILADIQDLKTNCGIKSDENTDWLKCAQSAIKLGSSVAQLVKDAKTKDIQKIVKDLQQILADIQDLKTNCGIKIDENTDWLKCAKSAIKLGSSVAQLVKDAKTKDIQKIVKDLQQILADIQDLKTNCGIKMEDVNTDWLKCAQSAIKLGSSVAQLVKDAKTKDIQKIVKDLQQILADIQDLKTNCGIKLLMSEEDDNTDWLKCAQSAIKLGSSVAQLVKDAKTKDIQKIVKDLQQILADIQDLKTNCGIKNPAFDMVMVNTDWLKCGKDAIVLAKNVSQLVKDAKEKDIQKIVKDLQDILATIALLKKDCGIKQPRLMFSHENDIAKCIQDGIKLVKTINELVKDAQAGDIKKVVQDLQAILAIIPDLKKDCLK